MGQSRYGVNNSSISTNTTGNATGVYQINVTAENTKGRAIVETANWYGAQYYIGTNTDWPLATRMTSAFGVSCGNPGFTYNNNGTAATNVTFRPVIWN